MYECRVVVVLAPSFFPVCLLSESLYKVDVYNIRMWVEIPLGICWGLHEIGSINVRRNFLRSLSSPRTGGWIGKRTEYRQICQSRLFGLGARGSTVAD